MNIFSFQTHADFPRKDDDAATLNSRLLAKFAKSRASDQPLLNHDDVMADARAIIDGYRNNETHRQS